VLPPLALEVQDILESLVELRGGLGDRDAHVARLASPTDGSSIRLVDRGC
jgi:hypothetical protein